jgi:hypothetical protein
MLFIQISKKHKIKKERLLKLHLSNTIYKILSVKTTLLKPRLRMQAVYHKVKVIYQFQRLNSIKI